MTNVHIPSDRGTGKNKTFAFVSYRQTCSVKYACELFNTLRLFRKPIYCKPTENKSSGTPTNNDLVTGSPNYSTPARPANRAQQSPLLTTPQLYSNNREGNTDRDSERKRYGSDYRRSESYDRRQYDNRYDNQRSHGSGNWGAYAGNSYNQNQWGSPVGHGQNYNNRNSPSNYGPIRNDSQRNSSNRNNRRQSSQPY